MRHVLRRLLRNQMPPPKDNPSVFNGTGSASWLLHILLFGILLYLFLPSGEYGMVGLLAAFLASQKIESNGLKKRIRSLEVVSREN